MRTIERVASMEVAEMITAVNRDALSSPEKSQQKRKLILAYLNWRN